MQNTVTNLFGDPQQPVAAPHRARVVAITSGKGGVGKTSITADRKSTRLNSSHT